MAVVSDAVALDNPGMGETWIREHWALLGAGMALLAVIVVLLLVLYRRSRRGRLASFARAKKVERRSLDLSINAARKARARLERLEKKAGRVAPKTLDKARGALQDAVRLVEIRKGALQVAENHLRMIIVEEFPPARHEALRKRFGVSQHPDNRPFSFDGS